MISVHETAKMPVKPGAERDPTAPTIAAANQRANGTLGMTNELVARLTGLLERLRGAVPEPAQSDVVEPFEKVVSGALFELRASQEATTQQLQRAHQLVSDLSEAIG